MNPISFLFKQLETRIKEIESDLLQIKKLVSYLEEENNSLREKLAVFAGQEPKSESQEQALGGAFENLKKIYDEGFHICNVHFGRLRQEECLFCTAFLERGK